MARTIAIGIQDFETLVSKNCFYVDKTDFIYKWWENEDSVTLITRPRRFGKTLAMSMVERFFSVKYAGNGDIFKELHIWEKEKYRNLQGNYPVINLSFAAVKDNTYETAKKKIFQIIIDLYDQNRFLLEDDILSEQDKTYFNRVLIDMSESDAVISLQKLCYFMYRYYGKKTILLLDEYDTPMQEAYIYGYWNEIMVFIRNLFNYSFKTNLYLERAIMTGITRISKESVFSDLNNLVVVTSTSGQYENFFGFTQTEVTAALNEFGLSDREEEVKDWYDGFTFGKCKDIYNPWSIINFLKERKLNAYWANTSSNQLINKLIREGGKDIKLTMEDLLNGGILHTEIDEQIIFDQLDHNTSAIWSLLLASGYLKVEQCGMNPETRRWEYDLKLTNGEVQLMFERMILDWFRNYSPAYNDFIQALLLGDKKAMNYYMNRVALATFSNFDTGNKPSETTEPERFYHGFVLGLMVDLAGRYIITSNRESGFGRYDVMLKPKNPLQDHAIIMEFKVQDEEDEKTLQETVDTALLQIDEKRYATMLEEEGIPAKRICKYGFAFHGKKVLIG